jgi:DNA-binding response OmpR family regulator
MANILFVEDDADFAAPHKTLIESAGHKVEIVGDGVSALKRAQKERFSLMIIDVGLPLMNGHDLCRELRKRGDDCPPILILSDREDERSVIQGLGCADEYVRKSCPTSELLLRIRRLLDRANDVEPKRVIYVFDNFEIDHYRREVRRNGKPIHLTQLEFKILLAFVETTGKCWLRDDLIDYVWKEIKTDRVVDQHILHLRKKIGQKYFCTVPGGGYRFDANVTLKKL